MVSEQPGIYSIRNIESGGVYVGSAANLARRFSEHLRMLHRKDHENEHLQRAWDKYGEDSFAFGVECFCEQASLEVLEQEYINYYASVRGLDALYNMLPVAGSRLGCKHTPESIAKMSRQQFGEGNGFYGKKHTPESIEKMRQSHRGQVAWNKGKPWSDEIRSHISEARKGCAGWNTGLTKETSDGVRRSADARLGTHMWGPDKPHPCGMLGKQHTGEVKQRISESMAVVAKDRERDVLGHFVKS